MAALTRRIPVYDSGADPEERRAVYVVCTPFDRRLPCIAFDRDYRYLGPVPRPYRRDLAAYAIEHSKTYRPNHVPAWMPAVDHWQTMFLDVTRALGDGYGFQPTVFVGADEGHRQAAVLLAAAIVGLAIIFAMFSQLAAMAAP